MSIMSRTGSVRRRPHCVPLHGWQAAYQNVNIWTTFSCHFIAEICLNVIKIQQYQIKIEQSSYSIHITVVILFGIMIPVWCFLSRYFADYHADMCMNNVQFLKSLNFYFDSGAKINSATGFKETTSDDVCTQYSTANCTVYWDYYREIHDVTHPSRISYLQALDIHSLTISLFQFRRGDPRDARLQWAHFRQ